MKKVVSILIAGTIGVSGSLGVKELTNQKNILSAVNVNPYVIELSSLDLQNSIQEISFTTTCNTQELEPERSFLIQGIAWYTNDKGESVNRTFSDSVSNDSKDYSTVAGKEKTKSKFILGSVTNPLHMDPKTRLTIEFTWITASSISMTNLTAKDVKGNKHTLAKGTVYTTYISERNEEAFNTSVTMDGMPFKSAFWVSSIFNEYRGVEGYHMGMDLVSEGDLTVFATDSGTVVYADWENPWDYYQGFGKYVEILGDDGLHYFYGHLNDISVSLNQRIEKGQPIGVQGTTGSSTGDHLHYEIRNNNGSSEDCAVALGIPNEYGEVFIDTSTLSPTVISDTTDDELAIKMISLNKFFETGHLKANAINPNDLGAMSLGCIQFRGPLAKGLLTEIYNKNITEYVSIANKYNSNFSTYHNNSDEWWSSYATTAGSNDYNWLTELLIQDWAVEAQWNYMLNYEKNIIQDARDNGITNEDCIILYSRSVNYGMYTDSSKNLRLAGNKGALNNLIDAAPLVSFLKSVETLETIDTKSYPLLTINDIK